MHEKIKKWYEQGLWTEDMVRRAGEKGVLTVEQVAEILSGSVSSSTKQQTSLAGLKKED